MKITLNAIRACVAPMKTILDLDGMTAPLLMQALDTALAIDRALEPLELAQKNAQEGINAERKALGNVSAEEAEKALAAQVAFAQDKLNQLAALEIDWAPPGVISLPELVADGRTVKGTVLLPLLLAGVVSK